MIIDHFNGNIDFDKYKTFVLEYMKDNNSFSSHIVRPTTATYEEITDTNRFRSYTLEAAVAMFKHEASLAEILLECAMLGIPVDFIDIVVSNDKKEYWGQGTKIQQVIDTHKKDVTKFLEQVEAKRFYIAKNKNRNDSLKFLVIDRYAQKNDVEFLKGEYDKKAAVAGFKTYDDAKVHCEQINEHI